MSRSYFPKFVSLISQC